MLKARSVRNKLDEIKELILVNSWDIIGITETWIRSNDRDFIGEYSLKGYNLFNKDRLNKKGEGVLHYIKEALNPIEHSLDSNQEIICIDLNLEIKIRLVLIYRPASQTYQQDMDLFMVLSHQIQNKMSVVMGHLNCPWINWETVSAEKEGYQLINFYSENFLSQFVLQPMRGENILDIILATEDDLIKEVVIGNPLGNSDHSTVQLKVAKKILERNYLQN